MGLKLRSAQCSYKEEKCGVQPVSPSSQALSTSILSLCIQIVFEFEQPVVEIDALKRMPSDVLLPLSPRFDCLLEEDDVGVLWWRKTKVNIDDHFIIPEFPAGQESYDKLVSDYICNLCITSFDPSRPLWEFHLLNYKTSRAGGTLIIKIHHAIGDGISLMSALFSSVSSADNPALPPTFPAPKKNDNIKAKGMAGSEKWWILKYFGRAWFVLLVLWYTMVDVVNSVMRMMGWLEDSDLPIRGPPGVVELMPVAISSIDFPLQEIKKLKTFTGATVNDVLTGIIFCGVQRYLQICLSSDAGGGYSLQEEYDKRFKPNVSVIKHMKSLRVTTLSMINQRKSTGVENLEAMMKPNAKIPWGNHFGFLHLRMPLESVENPLDFVKRAKCILDRQKMSLGIYFVAKFFGLLGILKGPQAIATFAYKTIASTTMAISNMVGPIEKIAFDRNIVKRFSFFVSGAPQTLSVHILSYMDTITMQVIAQKDYINVDMLSSLFREAFEKMEEEYIHNNLEKYKYA